MGDSTEGILKTLASMPTSNHLAVYDGQSQSTTAPQNVNLIAQQFNLQVPSAPSPSNSNNHNVTSSNIPIQQLGDFEQKVIAYAKYNQDRETAVKLISWLTTNDGNMYIKGQRVNGTKKDFKSLPGNKVNLSRAVFHQCDFCETNFSYTIVKKADFTGSNLQDAIFTGVEGLSIEQLIVIQSEIGEIRIDPKKDEKNIVIRTCAKKLKEMIEEKRKLLVDKDSEIRKFQEKCTKLQAENERLRAELSSERENSSPSFPWMSPFG